MRNKRSRRRKAAKREGLGVKDVVQAFMELTEGTGKPPEENPIKTMILVAFQKAAEECTGGLTAPEVVKALIERELTDEEEALVILHTEPAEGGA